MSYASEVLADAPAVYFRCQEASGLIQDSSGNARNATAIVGSGATYQQSSPIATDPSDFSINFDSAEAYTVPDQAGLDLGDIFSMEAWVKLGELNPPDDRYVITKGANSYSMWVNGVDTGYGIGYLGLVAPTVGIPCHATVAFSDTTNFHHCVITKSGGTVHLYMDGVDVTGVYTPNTFADTAVTLFLGCSRTSDAFSRATLDEIAVYPTALTQPSQRLRARRTIPRSGSLVKEPAGELRE